MNCRDYAKKNGVEVVGRLKRMPDHFDPFVGEVYRWFMDEAETEYHMDKISGKWHCVCIVTADNRVI